MTACAHPHPHPHHPDEHANPPGAEVRHRPQAGAVLDIGGTVGALLVHCPAELEDTEIQLYDLQGRNLTHTEVHRRDTGSRVGWSGLFPGLEQGEYLVEVTPGGARHQVRVGGGKVATVDAR